MYPSGSSFISAEPASAWWAARVGSDTAVCSTTGSAFVRALQRTLGVQVDGAWGEGTSRALATALLAKSAPASLVSGVNADANAHLLGPNSLLAAIWLLHRNARGPVPGNLTTADLVIPQGVQFPQWGHASPGAAGDESVSCSVITGAGGTSVTWQDAQHLFLPPGVALTTQESGSSAPWPLVLTIGGVAVAAIAISVWLTPRRPAASRSARRKRYT